MKNSHSYNLAIYIAGPRIWNYHKKNIDFLNQHASNVIVIGEIEENKSKQDHSSFQDNLYKVKEYIEKFAQDERVLVYIAAHGITDTDLSLIIYLDNVAPCDSNAAFFLLNNVINQPLDIIFTPCHGKAAVKDVSYLPENSRVLFFSDANGYTVFINSIMNQKALFNNTKISLDIYYDNYVANLGMTENPIIVSYNNLEIQSIDPFKESNSYLGKNISSAAREYVSKNFATNICASDVTCHQNVNNVINKIEGASSLDIFKIEAKEELVDHYKDEYKHIKSELNFFKELASNQTCPIKYSYTMLEKNNVDLFYLNLPINSNLDKVEKYYDLNYLEKVESHLSQIEQIGLDNYLSIIRKNSNFGIINNLIEDEGYTLNDNFPMPEYAEYGLVLGIIKDLYNFDHNSPNS